MTADQDIHLSSDSFICTSHKRVSTSDCHTRKERLLWFSVILLRYFQGLVVFLDQRNVSFEYQLQKAFYFVKMEAEGGL